MTTLRKLAAAACILAASIEVMAAPSDSIPNRADGETVLGLNLEARLDYQLVTNSGETNRSQTGFMGKYIALKAEGTITKGLSYVWRQRFSRTPKDNTFWDQTDLLNVSYKTGKLDLGAGKQVVMIGGYEYDRAPINLMCPNLFVSDVACYQFGVSAGYQVSAHDHVAFQVSQSMFATSADRNLYAYNLMWNSGRDLSDLFRLETIWSVNEIEYERGKYCNYVALGNKLVVDNRFTILLDLMARTYPKNRAFKNNTFMIEGSWDITPKWKVTAKASYDCNLGVNRTSNAIITRGSQLAIGGVVGEWYPIQNKRHLLRLHAAAFYSKGKNLNPDDLMHKNTFYGSVGLTWHMNLLNIRK